MKLRLFTPARLIPICAVLVLTACNNSSDEELSDEALSMDEVAAAAANMEMSLTPGEYRATSELIEFNLPGLAPEAQQMAEQGFAEGAASGHTYCITPEMTPDQWVSQMNESACTVTRFDGDGDALNAVLECSDTQGMNGRVEMTGSASGDSSEMEVRFSQQVPGVGEGQIKLRMKSERIGECS